MRNISRPRLMAVLSAGFSVAALIAAVPASAQSPAGQPSSSKLPDFSVRLGAYLPLNSRIKQNVGNTAYCAGVDYVLSRNGPSDENTVSLDYIDRESGSNHLQMIPLMFGGIHYIDVKATSKSYVGYGVGAYFTSVSVPDSVGFQENNHTTLYGGYINAGYEFPQNIFADARYHFTQAVGSVNPSGLELTVGMRF